MFVMLIVQDIKKRLTKLGIDFQKNLNEANEILHFAEEELRGLPQGALPIFCPACFTTWSVFNDVGAVR